ncbi:MAG TPA: Hpt domain-containing protein, partial [Dissulfurispiraceae bacterium]
MADEMDEIISEFITEAEETLEKIDPMFVSLETKGYDKDALNEIFRGMHTLKGAAGFLGFQQIVDVAHRAESIMKKLRDAEVELSRELMDVILKSVDNLRLLIFHIKLKDGIEEDLSGLLKELDNALEFSAAAGGRKTEAAPEAKVEVEEEQPEETQAEEKAEKEEKTEAKVETAPSHETHPRPSAEEQVQQITKEREVVSNLRVDVTRIDKVMDLAGEIVLARNRLLNLAAKLDANYSDDPQVESLLETTGFLDRVTSDLQLAVMKMRM